MKTLKLNLKQIKVESFVTSLNEKESGTVKGGVNTLASALFGVIGCLIIYAPKEEELGENSCSVHPAGGGACHCSVLG